MATEVINYDKMRQQIADAQRVGEVTEIRDKMAALVKYYSSERNPEEKRRARELWLLAQARLGEMSLTLKKEGGPGRGNEKTPPKAESFMGKIETLKSAGISTQDASNYERLSRLPKEELIEAAHNGTSIKAMLKKLSADELTARGHSPKSERQLDTETGSTVSKVEALKRKAKAEGKAEAAQEEPIQLDTFSMSVQEKIEVWKRQQRKLIDAEVEESARELCHKMLTETFLPFYNERHAEHERIVKNRLGMMTKANYNKIRSCLHPDRVQDAAQKKLYEEAFRIFNDLELLFLNEKERPTSASFKMPTTIAEMMAMRR